MRPYLKGKKKRNKNKLKDSFTENGWYNGSEVGLHSVHEGRGEGMRLEKWEPWPEAADMTGFEEDRLIQSKAGGKEACDYCL